MNPPHRRPTTRWPWRARLLPWNGSAASGSTRASCTFPTPNTSSRGCASGWPGGKHAAGSARAACSRMWSSGRNWFRPRRRTGSSGDGSRAMRGTRRTNTPTASQPARRSVRSARTGWCRRGSTPGSPRSAPAGATATTIPIRSCMSVFKDGVTANTHFLNVLPDGAAAPQVERIPLYEVYMRMAEELAKRSTCARLQVGTVVTDQVLENVLAIGYNGNARGLANTCDSTVPGNCGCIHSEMNALVKAPGSVRDKVVFVSASPCVMCAKMAINANVARVYYRDAYRDPAGLDVLRQGGVEVIHYDQWRDHWRNRT